MNPEAMQTSAADPQRSKGRRMLLLLLLVFALPVLLVVALYQLQWRPQGSSHGQLQSPPRALALETWLEAGGAAFDAARWKDKWTLVIVDGHGCPAGCQQRAQLLRQVHAALNKEIDRVQRVLVLPNGIAPETRQILLERYPDLHLVTEHGALAAQFDLPGAPAATSGRVYLVDPLGNWMMSYPPGFDAKGLLADLQRLMKYSWVG